MEEEKIRISPIIFAMLLIIILLIIAIGRRINEKKAISNDTDDTYVSQKDNIDSSVDTEKDY